MPEFIYRACWRWCKEGVPFGKLHYRFRTTEKAAMLAAELAEDECNEPGSMWSVKAWAERANERTGPWEPVDRAAVEDNDG